MGRVGQWQELKNEWTPDSADVYVQNKLNYVLVKHLLFFRVRAEWLVRASAALSNAGNLNMSASMTLTKRGSN
jgi:hypothetical protein